MPEVNAIAEAAPLAAVWQNKTVAATANRLRTDGDYRRAVAQRLRETAELLDEWTPPAAVTPPPVATNPSDEEQQTPTP